MLKSPESRILVTGGAGLIGSALVWELNRRGFENFFTQELERTRRHNTFGSVLILFDLDKFKQINDTYGHQAGDACLKKVAECLLKNIRSVDAAARLGGDEFAVLLSHTDPEKSASCINEIRKALNGLQAVWQETTLHISASIGVKHVSDISSFETAYHAADQALYNDKRQRKGLSAQVKTIADTETYKIINLGISSTETMTENNSVPVITQFMLNAL